MTEEAKYVEKNLIFYDAMETLHTWQCYQKPDVNRDYIECACEALSKNAGKAAILQKLYNEIANKSTFDTAMIDASNGTFTKFKGYKSTISATESLEKLFNDEGAKITKNCGEELALIRKLHSILESYRSDFEFGYKSDEFIIISIYRLCVLTILELINVGMMNYMLIIRNNVVDINLKKSEQRKIVTNAKRLITTFDKGNFAKMIGALKKHKPATEAAGFVTGIGAKILAAGGSAFGVGVSAVNSVAAFVTGRIAIAAAVIALWWTVLMGIHYFYIASAKVESWLSTQAEIIQFNIEQDKTNTSNEKKQRNLERMQSIARFIRVRILKTEAKSEQEDLSFAQTELDRTEMQSIAESTDEYDDDSSTYGQYSI